MNNSWSAWAMHLVRVVKQGRVRHFVAFCALLIGLPIFAFGQEATIVGTVTDPSASVVPNVAVTITNVDTGETRSSVTNDTGQYVSPGLPIGHYNVSAKATGFGQAERAGIVLNVNDRTRVDFVLKVGGTSENVTVEANAVQVQSDSGEVSTVITGQQITELTTNGRSLYSLFNLTPGASSIQGDFMVPTPVSGDANVSINGQRAGHNLQLLDGGENLDRGGSSGSVMPSLDALQEFRELTSNYSAEYGLAGAATITTVVKSGTKQFHASAWEFDRNDAFDARNYFNPAPAKVAELRFNTFGFNAGGQVPLFKSHPTFFFYNMEWRRLIQGGLTNQTVPFTDTYGGDFAANLPADSKDPGGNVVPNSGLHVPCANQLSMPKSPISQQRASPLSARRTEAGHAQFPLQLALQTLCSRPSRPAPFRAGCLIRTPKPSWLRAFSQLQRADISSSVETIRRPTSKKKLPESIINLPTNSRCSAIGSPSRSLKPMAQRSGAAITFLRSAMFSAIPPIAPSCIPRM